MDLPSLRQGCRAAMSRPVLPIALALLFTACATTWSRPSTTNLALSVPDWRYDRSAVARSAMCDPRRTLVPYVGSRPTHRLLGLPSHLRRGRAGQCRTARARGDHPHRRGLFGMAGILSALHRSRGRRDQCRSWRQHRLLAGTTVWPCGRGTRCPVGGGERRTHGVHTAFYAAPRYPRRVPRPLLP